MKYLLFVVKTLILFIFQLIMTLMGMVVIPFFLKRTEPFECEHEDSRPSIRFKDKLFDAVFGNSEDGLEGDIYYKAKTTPSLWTTYNWCAIRNPIHNLALRMGVNAVITKYTWIGNRYTEDSIGHEGYVYSEATDINGNVYQMFRLCKLWYKGYGVELNIGYKNFNIQEVDRYYKYSFTVSFNPFKKFEE